MVAKEHSATRRGPDRGAQFLLGPDSFRLDNNLLHLKGESNYLQERHLITGGLEYELPSARNEIRSAATAGRRM